MYILLSSSVGVISCNGEDGREGAGGASGGSIWISTTELHGSGLIQSNGGGGSTPGTGGGAGGRIAVHYQHTEFSGMIQAYGGRATNTGGPGTVYLRDKSTDSEHLTVDAGQSYAANASNKSLQKNNVNIYFNSLKLALYLSQSA